MTTSFVGRGTEIIKEAVIKDNEEKFDEALNLYLRGVEFLMTGMKYEKNVKILAAIRSKVDKYLDRAESIKKMIKEKEQNVNNEKRKNQKQLKKNTECKDNENNNNSDDNDEERARLRCLLSQVVLMSKPKVTFNDIGGLDVAKSLLEETVVLPIRFPHLFDEKSKRKSLNGILLYGPAGTGKSYLAKAVANCTNDNTTFFSVSSADLVSKYVGESAKLVRELYTMARENKPSIIFIDEIDSLVTKRNDNDQSSSRNIKTEFLVQMQGVGKNMDGILTLGATNCPWDLDPAIRRRFGKRIYIPLPNIEARKLMFKLHIGENNCKLLSDNDFNLLAKKTDGFSGSDINNVVQDALMEPLRTMQNATHFKKVFNDNDKKDNSNNDYTLVACSPNDPNAIKMRLLDVSKSDEKKVRCEELKLTHFLRILKSAKTSVGKEDIQRHVEWTKQFGQEGS